tara:strand:+ start:945 stop:1247 length:303 start_codon:yes stop_codon:yes gene_type:complete
MIFENYNLVLYNEISKYNYSYEDYKTLLDNENVRIYLFLINNIKNNIDKQFFLNDIEWNFYIDKLLFLKKLIKSTNLIQKHKVMLIKNVNDYLRFLNYEL